MGASRAAALRGGGRRAGADGHLATASACSAPPLPLPRRGCSVVPEARGLSRVELLAGLRVHDADRLHRALARRREDQIVGARADHPRAVVHLEDLRNELHAVSLPDAARLVDCGDIAPVSYT